MLGFLAVAVNACTDIAPVNCGDGMAKCPMGNDANGCPMPETCVSNGMSSLDKLSRSKITLSFSKGMTGNDGTACPTICPCMADQIHCGGGDYDDNGCQKPYDCQPAKSRFI